MTETKPVPAKSVYSAEEMKSFGVEPCEACKVMPGFIPSKYMFEGKPLHVFQCPKCDNIMGDFLLPNDEDEGVKYWNEMQRERRSERLDPFDRDWHEAHIMPALAALGVELENTGRVLHQTTFRRKAELEYQLSSLDELASQMAATVAKLRVEFAKRHKPIK